MDKKGRTSVLLVVAVLSIFAIREVEAQGVISLPWTGQSKCYDSSGTVVPCAGTGKDGDIHAGVNWPNLRFTTSGNCVTDNLTGLIWAKDGNLPKGTRTWQGSLDYVASMNSESGLCGYKNWRLPNVNELESLLNAGEANSATWLNNPTQGFTNVQSGAYWSSTALPNNYARYVNISSGKVEYIDQLFYYFVWPVRSGQTNNPDDQYPANVWQTGQKTMYAPRDDGDLERGVAWPSPRFTDQGDGTITDKLTGLMWTKNADLAGGTTDWQSAIGYLKTLNIGGYSDWRLPNRKELFSLIDHSKYAPALPADHLFQNVRERGYWSSTTYAYDTEFAWTVDLADGWVDFNGGGILVCYDCSVLAVRSCEVSKSFETNDATVFSTGCDFKDSTFKDVFAKWYTKQVVVNALKGVLPIDYPIPSIINLAMALYSLLRDTIDLYTDPVIIIPLSPDVPITKSNEMYAYLPENASGLSGIVLLDFIGKRITQDHIEKYCSGLELKVTNNLLGSVYARKNILTNANILSLSSKLNYIIVPKSIFTMEEIVGAGWDRCWSDLKLSAEIGLRNVIGVCSDMDEDQSSIILNDLPNASDCNTGETVEISIGSSTSGWMCGDSDLFLLKVPTKMTVQIYTTGAVDTIGELLDSGCQSIATDDNSGADGNFFITQEVEAGTYHVVVSSSLLAYGRYTLHVKSVEYMSKDNLCNGQKPCFPNIQSGVVSASAPTELRITQNTYNENIILDVDKKITLQGGWDINFTSNLAYTTIQGSITITKGTMILENIIVK